LQDYEMHFDLQIWQDFMLHQYDTMLLLETKEALRQRFPYFGINGSMDFPTKIMLFFFSFNLYFLVTMMVMVMMSMMVWPSSICFHCLVHVISFMYLLKTSKNLQNLKLPPLQVEVSYATFDNVQDPISFDASRVVGTNQKIHHTQFFSHEQIIYWSSNKIFEDTKTWFDYQDNG